MIKCEQGHRTLATALYVKIDDMLKDWPGLPRNVRDQAPGLPRPRRL